MRSLFISHGAPELALQDSAAGRFLDHYGGSLPRPDALIVVSAHDLAHRPRVSGHPKPATVHDYGGFDPALRQIRYPAVVDTALASQVHALLSDAGFSPGIDPQRGLDHGVWVPLSRMFPAAEVPLVTLSINPNGDASYHYHLGAALQSLATRNILLIGSGGLVHNLSALDWQDGGTGRVDWADAFASWMTEQLIGGRRAELLAWQELAPFADRAHPSHEHLLPLFVALGFAGSEARVQHLHRSTQYGSLALDAFGFD